jgi:hypothetical protein
VDTHTSPPDQAAAPPLRGKAADPEFRHRRAVKAAEAATTLDSYIDRVVRRAGQLTPEQMDRLRALLPPSPLTQPGAQRQTDVA